MNMLRKTFLLISSTLVLTLSAITGLLAHPGHGATDGHSLWHYLTEPFHVISLVAAVAILISIIFWYMVKRRQKARVNA